MASNKFGRTYFLSIQPNVIGPGIPNIEIAPPFTIEFDVTRDVLGSLNHAQIKIYNLSPNTRNLLLKDYNNFNNNRIIYLQAGYGTATNLPTIFYGCVFQAYSRRVGTDFLTEITAQSGGYSPPDVFYSGPPFAAGSTDRVVIEALVNNLAAATGLSVGFIGNYPNRSVRMRSPSKPILEELKEISGGGVFIDQTSINVFNNVTESITTPVPLINSSTGLLETPSREQTRMTIPILFTPEIRPGQLINLQSSTVEGVNGFSPYVNSYSGIARVNSVHHMGMISDSVCGSLTTELGVILGSTIA